MSVAASSTNGTALYGVTGWPLAQTLSPLLHNTGFRTLGINALYQKWEVPPEKDEMAVSMPSQPASAALR